MGGRDGCELDLTSLFSLEGLRLSCAQVDKVLYVPRHPDKVKLCRLDILYISTEKSLNHPEAHVSCTGRDSVKF
jgi:hypothetical protein